MRRFLYEEKSKLYHSIKVSLKISTEINYKNYFSQTDIKLLDHYKAIKHFSLITVNRKIQKHNFLPTLQRFPIQLLATSQAFKYFFFWKYSLMTLKVENSTAKTIGNLN
jgi:hypothetical protein